MHAGLDIYANDHAWQDICANDHAWLDICANDHACITRYVCLVGLCIIYFKRYDTYHDTHEVIFDMYKKIDISTNFTGIWEI